jgi:hypothetical protein
MKRESGARVKFERLLALFCLKSRTAPATVIGERFAIPLSMPLDFSGKAGET